MEFDERWKKIAADSIGMSASDIHLMEGGSVYLRVDGRLKKMDDDTVLSREWMEDFLTASGGNVPDYSFEYGGRAFRVHAYTAAGKKMASLRLVPPSVPSLSEIGAPDGMSRALSLAHGLLLVCGRTGQGKTTTLAAIIDGWLKQHDGHLVTLEDPVEYRFTGDMISQMELGRDFHSFPEAMRDVVRMDPDIIMQGGNTSGGGWLLCAGQLAYIQCIRGDPETREPGWGRCDGGERGTCRDFGRHHIAAPSDAEEWWKGTGGRGDVDDDGG